MDTIRASDAERERTAALLRDAVGDGRLTLTEFDERLRRAYAAVTRADLATATADLPLPARPLAASSATPSVAPSRALPREWADAWRTWLGATLVMVGIWAATALAGGELRAFWPAMPAGIWASVLVLSMIGGHRPHRGCLGRR